METKLETLFGGRVVGVKLVDGADAEIKVRQILLGEYQAALKLLEDEIAFVAFVCGIKSPETKVQSPESANHQPTSINQVEPEYYEALHAAALEVNAKGFFSWKARRDLREQEKESQRLASQAGADATKELVLRSAMMGTASPSPVGSPPQRPERR